MAGGGPDLNLFGRQVAGESRVGNFAPDFCQVALGFVEPRLDDGLRRAGAGYPDVGEDGLERCVFAFDFGQDEIAGAVEDTE